MSLFSALFGTYSDRELKKIRSKTNAVLELQDKYARMTEGELRSSTDRFRRQINDGAMLDDVLPDAFAAVREASTRVLGMTHFPVQIQGGIILHQGRIAEMRTGEGKTLVATLPAYLNALNGEGVHIITVNDYLAHRDSEWMGKIYRYLGLSVGLIVHGLDKTARRAAYAADVTYGTNNEFGFDYLRDNMVLSLDQCVQRQLNYAIVDEVDSILVDEARTPLIISGAGTDSSEMYQRASDFARGLTPKVIIQKEAMRTTEELMEIESDADYIVDEKAKSSVLTERGVKKAERYFGVDNLSDQENYEINHHISNALKARGTMHLDRDYVIIDGEIVIVDDFTGRLMYGRRYSNGLHQAIEAKEGVEIKEENKTLATITFQNYFRMYNKLSGMTGTAMTEESEFREIYNLDVVTIPTNVPMIRQDDPDAVYKTESGKFRAILEDVRAIHVTGQPVLVGTVSVEKSEILSQLFTRAGIRHNVLNARHHEREAEIVAQAGRFGAVTIATNMAGRGTDILLGGNPEFLARQEMRKQGYDEELIEQSTAYNVTDDEVILKGRALFASLKKHFSEEIEEEKQRVIDAGGLCIVGTERHESRRIDNQLRGRAGRQGDPGYSKFYLSLEDDLMRLFGGERMDRIFSTLGVDEDMEIAHPLLTKTIESAQRRVEGMNFAIRKNVLEYDDVMNTQRNLIYKQRREVLEGHDLEPYYKRIISETMDATLADFLAISDRTVDWDKEAFVTRVNDMYGPLPSLTRFATSKEDMDGHELASDLKADALMRHEERGEELGSTELLREAERIILLHAVDRHWMDHIDLMDDLRDSIGMRGYAQHDPVVEYKREGYDMFEAMNEAIQRDAVRLIMRARLTADDPAPKRRVPTQLLEGRGSSGWSRESAGTRPSAPAQSARTETQGGDSTSATPYRKKHVPGRNEPCWCGSGKKYKNCHLRQDEMESM
ncbi:MAG TPA: preprotein translocase subunit SecA [Clostridiaceae bacterium]|jgi:preprotein translocase subunit SecA|nr:preprotein translocase subunit SecA [Clostridiaceae bacterium]